MTRTTPDTRSGDALASRTPGEIAEQLPGATAAFSHGVGLLDDASPTWRALDAGVRKLIDDLMTPVHLENSVPFVQFARAGAASAPCCRH